MDPKLLRVAAFTGAAITAKALQQCQVTESPRGREQGAVNSQC